MKKIYQMGAIIMLLLFMAPIALAQPSFYNKIKIPPLVEVAEGDTIKLELGMYRHEFNPQSPTQDNVLNGYTTQNGIQSWAYNVLDSNNMSILGPTLLWRANEQIKIQVTNHLNQPTTTHWHGAEVPAKFDGGPHQPISVDSTWMVDFVDLDGTSTMWYHPHYHDNTYPQVQMGLSGMIISVDSTDGINNTLPRTYGVDDIPLIIGDAQTDSTFDQLSGYYVTEIDSGKSNRPYNIVNGYTNPYYDVPAHMVRLRILNGSTRKGIRFAVSDSPSGSTLNDFYLVGTDGGFTMKPDTLQELQLGPGARAEIVVNLNGKSPGDVVYLRNMKFNMGYDIIGSPYPNPFYASLPNPIIVGGKDTTGGDSFIQLRVISDPAGYIPVNAAPNFTSTWPAGTADTSIVDTTRHKFLKGHPNKVAQYLNVPATGFTIDDITYDMMTVNDVVCEGAREVWEITNNTIIAHPFHIHKIFFRILTIKDSTGQLVDLEPLGLNGPKDDILIREGWTVRFYGVFDDYGTEIAYDSTYMYHCHILTHEDNEGGGMMHQFVVANPDACATASVDELANDPVDFVLYPNPSTGLLYLRGKSTENTTVRVVSLNGQVLREEQLTSFTGDWPIDIAGVSNGVYLVVWETSKGTLAKKVVIE